MTTEGYKRKLTAILSADVKGYSRLMGEDEEATLRTLTAYRNAMSDLVQQYRGRVVDALADRLLAEFTSVVDAVNCTVEIQRDLAERNADLPHERKMEFRIGVNLGDVIEEDKRIYGDGVNIAARVESLAEPGGICISGTVYDSIQQRLGLEYEYLGEQEVKNIVQPVRVYKILIEPESIQEKDDAPLKSLVNLEIPDKPSIAVLPFTNMSGDPEQEYFSDGITEEIITALSKVPHIFVIARNSTFTYKGKPVRVQQVGKELGVRYVLEGSVRKAGDRVRITAQLIDTKTGHHLWADRYDRDLEDIFALQDEISMKILTELRVNLIEGEGARMYGTSTTNLEAYLKVMKGVEHVWRWNKNDNAIGRQLYKEAIALDPEYAGAYELLAMTYRHDAVNRWTTSPENSYERALELARKALSLDESHVRGSYVLTIIYSDLGQLEKALTEGKRLVTLEPNNADNNIYFADVLSRADRHEEAIELIGKAIRLNPVVPGWYAQYIFRVYRRVGRTEEAISIIKKLADLNPAEIDADPHIWLGFAYRITGNYKEAIAKFRKGLRMNPDWLSGHIGLTVTYSQAGLDDEARAEAAEVLRIDPRFSVERQYKMLPHKNETDKELVIDALRKAGLK